MSRVSARLQRLGRMATSSCTPARTGETATLAGTVAADDVVPATGSVPATSTTAPPGPVPGAEPLSDGNGDVGAIGNAYVAVTDGSVGAGSEGREVGAASEAGS